MNSLGCVRRAGIARKRWKRPSGAHGTSGGVVRHGSPRALLSAVLPAIFLLVMTRTLLVGLYRVPTASMADTIEAGDCILGERLSGRLRGPCAGEVVTFESQEQPGTMLVKRVIATEGQTVDLHDGAVVVDGRALCEPYAAGGGTFPVVGNADVSYPHVVAKGCVWVMGDNRGVSRDSRWFGDVPASRVTSRILCIYWPPDRVGIVR